MFKKPLVWAVFTLASVCCLLLSWQYFTAAFPTLHIDATMTRDAALAQARSRAAALGWLQGDTRTAVRFEQDRDTQYFMELEGGGKDAFLALIRNGVYQPLRWEVRLFREKDPVDTVVQFTPQGRPYGLRRTLPEAQPGAALPAAEARRIAETAAARDWGLDLAAAASPFALVEQTQETRPGGRIDHQFVYERRDQRLGRNGEGRVRVELTVAGDSLSRLQHAVRIPESFTRRYAQMRAANNVLSQAAAIGMGVLYGIGGCVIGLLLLWRAGFVLSRPAFAWAAVVAGLGLAADVSNLQRAWFNYDSALTASDFLTRQIAIGIGGFVATLLMLALTFMAAEGLSRKAFGAHPQLWRLWARGAGNSPEVLGRTVAGYLWVGFDLAFIVLFYAAARHWLGWWSPLDALVDPDVLATPMPWLGPVARSLQAGFWEECLFRAVPLAGAALIGDAAQRRFGGKLGGRTLWVAAALVVQALIFGGGHAGYAQQPAYARPLELFLPALLWGAVYLRFGLLPGIVFHFLFDLALMSLPLFAMQAPGLGLERACVVAAGLFPLLAVLWARWRAGRWQPINDALRNAAWRAPAAAAAQAEFVPDARRRTAWRRALRVLPPLGVAGAVLWLTLGDLRRPTLPMFVTRAQAEQAADAALHARGVVLGPQWQRSAMVERQDRQTARFVWREGGSQAYAALNGGFLPAPAWIVRYRRFDTDVAERVDEWRVAVESGKDGRGGEQAAPFVRDVSHTVPQARPGASLSREAARAVVRDTVRARFGLDTQALREVTADETHQPGRTDWTFVYALRDGFPMRAGEARIEVRLAGDEVGAVTRSIHVPEEWERSERGRTASLKLVQGVLGVALALLLLTVVIASLRRAAKGGVDWRAARPVGWLVFALALVQSVNGLPGFAFDLSSTQGIASQIALKAVTALLLAALAAAMAAVTFGVAGHRPAHDRGSFAASLLPGICLGFVLLGVHALGDRLAPPGTPVLPDFAWLGKASPALYSVTDGIGDALIAMAAWFCALRLLDAWSAHFTRRRVLTMLMLVAAGGSGALKADDLQGALLQLAYGGAAFVALYLLAGRFEPRALVVMMLTLNATGVVLPMLQPQAPHALGYALLGQAAMLAAAWWLARLADAQPARGAPAHARATRAAEISVAD